MTIKAVECLKRDFAFFLVLLAVIGFVVFPLSFIQVPFGHDILFHMERIASLSNEIREGILFPRIYLTALDNNGYGSPMFYGDLLLRVPALLVINGLSIPVAYKIFLMLIALSSAVVSYFCFNSIMKDKTSAAVGAILFSLSAYFATDLYERAAIGEAQVFIFLPIAFLGYYHIMFGDNKKWFFLPFGLFFILQSHMLSTIIFVILLALFTLFYVDRIFKSPSKVKYIGASVGLFFALSAYFIFPLIEQILSTAFFATDGTSATILGTLAQRAMPWWSIFSDFNSKISPWIPNGVGLIIIAIWIAYFILFKKLKGEMVLFYLSLSTILLLMTTELFPWEYFQSTFGILQFPWRLLIFSTFFIAISSMYLINRTSSGKSRAVISSVFIALSLFSFLMTVSGKYSLMLDKHVKGEVLEYNHKNYIAVGEYFPTRTDRNKLFGLAESIRTNNDNMTVSYARSHGKIDVTFFGNDSADTYIELPLIMYKGYSAVTENGTKMRVEFGDNNRVRVLLDDVKAGFFTVSYSGTAVQKISDAVSIVGFIFMFAYFLNFVVLGSGE